MTRVKRGYVARRHRNHILSITAGSQRARSRLFRTANQQAMKSMVSSHRDRGRRKRDLRRLWITRMNAAARKEGLVYSQLIHELYLANVQLNRKTLAQMAVLDHPSFVTVVSLSRLV